jgi:divinyl chlorophyllide a 8-vinyl-reductase
MLNKEKTLSCSLLLIWNTTVSGFLIRDQITNDQHLNRALTQAQKTAVIAGCDGFLYQNPVSRGCPTRLPDNCSGAWQIQLRQWILWKFSIAHKSLKCDVSDVESYRPLCKILLMVPAKKNWCDCKLLGGRSGRQRMPIWLIIKQHSAVSMRRAVGADTVMLSAFCVRNPWLQFPAGAKLKFEAAQEQTDMTWYSSDCLFQIALLCNSKSLKGGKPYVLFEDGKSLAAIPF